VNLIEAKQEALRQANETNRLFAVVRELDHGDDFKVVPFKHGETTSSWYHNFGVIGPGAKLA
jgi:hypothetical protein